RVLAFVLIISVAGFVAYTGMKRLDSGSVPGQYQSGTTEAAAKPDQPTLLSVSADQLSHLTIVDAKKATWSVNVDTTGTVDWDADHTTQAITQVSGPISRMVVDLGTAVKAGDPLLYVASADVANAISAYRKAKNRESLTKRTMDRQKDLLDRGAVSQKDYEGNV